MLIVKVHCFMRVYVCLWGLICPTLVELTTGNYLSDNDDDLLSLIQCPLLCRFSLITCKITHFDSRLRGVSPSYPEVNKSPMADLHSLTSATRRNSSGETVTLKPHSLEASIMSILQVMLCCWDRQFGRHIEIEQNTDKAIAIRGRYRLILERDCLTNVVICACFGVASDGWRVNSDNMLASPNNKLDVM